jgi:DNA-binding NarL/FixJ family response regulator
MNSKATLPEAIPSVVTDRAALSVLIIDDEPHARAYVRLILSALGVTTVWEAGNGAEGLALYGQHRPSLVMLDLNMPVMAGDVTMSRLGAIDPDVAVIVMTSENGLRTVRLFQELGAIGYVLKQSSREQATRMIQEALDSLLDYDDER